MFVSTVSPWYAREERKRDLKQLILATAKRRLFGEVYLGGSTVINLPNSFWFDCDYLDCMSPTHSQSLCTAKWVEDNIHGHRSSTNYKFPSFWNWINLWTYITPFLCHPISFICSKFILSTWKIRQVIKSKRRKAIICRGLSSPSLGLVHVDVIGVHI